METCWICRNREANSNEHIIKRSLIDLIHPELKRKTPIQLIRFELNSGKKTKKVIQGSKSPEFTFRNTICTDCNNRLTQRHDLAWEKLFRQIYKTPKNKKFIDLNDLFSDVKTESLNIQLYWLKITGCIIKDVLKNDKNIVFGEFIKKDVIWLNGLLEEFSKNITHENENYRFHLYFSRLPHNTNRATLYPGPLKRTNNIMHYSFFIGDIAITSIIYIHGPESHIIKTWQPHKNMRKIPLYNLPSD